ncbi:MAG TPA: response regulator [Opitutaceae bacterium]|jgi:FixJ family two-component response regulator|nr:response regulator [Opitutaceae bacterium]
MRPLPAPDPAPLVAIVDDDDSHRDSVRMLVRSFGFRTEVFPRAKDVLLWERINEAACLIVDVRMPEMSGLELQRHLMRIRPGLPIIFLTAHADEGEERQAMQAGAVALLRKPVADQVLMGMLLRVARAQSP